MTDELKELRAGGGVEKYVSPIVLADDGCGDRGAPLRRSGKTELPTSSENGLVIWGGGIMDDCHMDPDPAEAVWWLDPSTMTSLIPLWLVVLMAEGEDPSTAASVVPLLNDMWCSKPVNQSKPSSIC
jgi:hypothetical protein